MEHTTLRSILILLAAAVLVVVLLKRARLPTVIAYLATGFIVGPYGLGWIANSEDTRNLAEFGVVFLLFTLGLEFSVAKLSAMRKAVFVLGGLQVLLTAAGVALSAWLFGTHIPVAIVLGGAFAMSSTAIVVKQLAEQDELSLRHGRLTIAVLLFQDLAVIPFLILVPGLAHGIGPELARMLLLAFAKGALVIIVILAFGRWLLRPLFHQIASTRSAELFTLAVLLFTLACAWGTAALGLSLALGAFLAGMTLADTEYPHQVEADIRPFRDILLGLFFVTVGMLINPHTIARHWWLLIVSVILLMLFKTLLVAGLTRLLGNDRVTSLLVPARPCRTA
ncbi:MAG: monovalent cation:proton antiporter-2 (CPA2) family protein [Gammaproteobacteria bacterium]